MDYFGVKLHIKGKQLVWENGKTFFYLADTQWYALTNRVDERTFEQILLQRKKQGFTAIQLVVGIPPEIDIWDESAKSTNGYFAFNKDFTVNEQYFKDIESKIKLIVEHQLVPVVFGSWGQHIDIVGEKGIIELWTYILKFFSKYPVIYCLCGEVDIFPANKNLKNSFINKVIYKIPYLRTIAIQFLAQTHKNKLQNRLSHWQNVASHLKHINKDKHPVTVHIHSPRIASEVFSDSSWLDIDSFQSGHSLNGTNIMNKCFEKLKKGKKPFVNLESLYEGILGQFSSQLQNYAFWKSVFSGSIGHGYGAHGLWQMSNNDNFMSHWGKSTWQKALEYDGATSIGNAKKYLSHKNIYPKDLSENNNFVDISYKSIPTLAHLSAIKDKLLLIYIPYPHLVESIKLSKMQSVRLLDTKTYQIVGVTSNETELLTKLNKFCEIFLEVERV